MPINPYPHRPEAVYRLDQHEQAAHLVAGVFAYSAPLIFVTGASRSGTTMLARMLGSHSRIMTFQELHFFGSLCPPQDEGRVLPNRELSNLAATLLARQNHGLWGGGPTDVERAWGQRVADSLRDHERTPAGVFAATLSRLARDSGRERACEQTPRNIFYAYHLLKLYPNAQIIHIIRDPRAVLASQKKRWRLKWLGASHLPLSEMLRNRVNYHPLTMSTLWAKATEEAIKLEGHPRFLITRFEDLAANPKEEALRLCHFLGLKYETEMLHIPRWGSSNVSHDSESKGISLEVMDQWRSNLSRGEILICERMNHLLMQRFGYIPEQIARSDSLATIPSLLSYPVHVAGVLALNPVRAWIQLRAMIRNKVTDHQSQMART